MGKEITVKCNCGASNRTKLQEVGSDKTATPFFAIPNVLVCGSCGQFITMTVTNADIKDSPDDSPHESCSPLGQLLDRRFGP